MWRHAAPVITTVMIMVGTNPQSLRADDGWAFLTYALPLFLRTSDPHTQALGSSGVAASSGLSAMTTNPAGLIGDQGTTFRFSYLPSFNLLDWYYVGNEESFAVQHSWPGGLSAAVAYSTIDFFGEAYDGSHTPSESIDLYQFSMAKSLGGMSLGTSFKFVDQAVQGLTTRGWLFDLGFQGRLSLTETRHVVFGASVQNLGPRLKYKEEDFKAGAPRLLRVGAGISTLEPSSNAPIQSTISLEYQHILNTHDYRWDHLVVGAELIFFRHMFGQLGYNIDLRGKSQHTLAGKYQGLSWGFGFITPRDLTNHLPLRIALAYGRGVQSGSGADNNVDVSCVSASVLVRF